jgi:hypothetical protein
MCVLAACSGKSSNPPPTPDGGLDGGPEPIAVFCPNLLNAIAAVNSRCQGGPVSVWTTLVSEGFDCTLIDSEVSAGTLQYSPAEAGECIAGYSGTNCDDFVPGPIEPTCQAAIWGTLDAGASCSTGLECAGTDAYCKFTPGQCAGTCALYVADGQPCSQGDECVPGDQCNTNGTCGVAPPAVITPAQEGASCGYISAQGYTPCVLPYTCDTELNVCVPFVGEGATCPQGHNICEQFTACNSSGTCAVYPSTAGATCGVTQGQDYVGCLGTTYCAQPPDGGAGTCVAQGAAGAACSNNLECLSGSCGVDAGACGPVCPGH